MKITRGNLFALPPDGFEQFLLQRMNYKTAGDRLRYARQFAHVLQTGDASELLQLQPEKRIHAMKAISSLARYTGKYDVWLQIRRRYNLSWTSGNESLQSLERFFNDGLNYDVMLSRIKEMIQKLPTQIGKIIKFNVLTGLRPSEAIESVRLISGKDTYQSYYNPERQVLEHFRFPKVFIRRTKTAYISVVTPEILELAKLLPSRRRNANPYSYAAILIQTQRMGIPMRMSYCRKVFASHLRQSGIESEIVDLLQGRVPSSVFARHYFRPSASYKDRVLEAVSKLKKEIERDIAVV